MNWVKDETVCSIGGCWLPVKAKGWCGKHYQKFYKSDPTYLPGNNQGDKRTHKFYMLWFDRKQAKAICEEWANDFWKFVKDIEPKPEGNYFLVRLRNEPFGPTNFKWQEHLQRKEGETRKEWWARKWAARQAANPGMERARNLKRFYGFTIQQYEEMVSFQNGKCAICGEKEKSVDPKTGTIRRLAIDHNHITNKIRELLCWRCNGTLGKVEDSVALLQKMIFYLQKHGES